MRDRAPPQGLALRDGFDAESGREQRDLAGERYEARGAAVIARPIRAASWFVCCLAWCACSGLRDDLRRAEAAFVEARYEDVSAWLADLEPNVTDLPRPLRARYYYMAGVTAERLGDRVSALHYLLLCREEAQREGNGLSDDRRRNLALTLAELLREPPATSGSEP